MGTCDRPDVPGSQAGSLVIAEEHCQAPCRGEVHENKLQRRQHRVGQEQPQHAPYPTPGGESLATATPERVLFWWGVGTMPKPFL